MYSFSGVLRVYNYSASMLVCFCMNLVQLELDSQRLGMSSLVFDGVFRDGVR